MVRLKGDNSSLAKELFDIGAVKSGSFYLKHHEKDPSAPPSPFYIDLRIVRSFPNVKRKVVQAYADVLKGLEFELIADIPTSATPFVSSLSDLLGVPMISPRLDKKSYGSGAEIDGVFAKGQKVVLVDDLITKADSKIETANVLESYGLVVKDIVVLIDRKEGGRERLEGLGYNLHSVFKVIR